MDIIDAFVNRGMSISEIARVSKKSRNSIRKALNEAGILTNIYRNQSGICKSVNDSLFKVIDTPESAYWLGFLYADGNISSSKNEISLTLQERDRQSIINFHTFCQNQNNIAIREIKRNNKTYKAATSSFSSKQVKSNLITLGCHPRKSKDLTFPSQEQVKDNFLYDFIRGYIDGDGYVQYDLEKSRYRIIILGTFSFLSGLIERTGWHEGSKIYQEAKETIYRLELSKKKLVKERLCLLYENASQFLPRKYEVYLKTKSGL